MLLNDLLAILRRRWWLLALALVVGSALGLLAPRVQTPTYVATAQLYPQTLATSTGSDLVSGANYMRLQVQSYPQLVTSDPVLQSAADQVGGSMTRERLATAVTVDVPINTTWVNIHVEDPSADRAEAAARALADASKTAIEDLEGRAQGTTDPVAVKVVHVSGATRATGIQPLVALVAGGLLGLLGGIALVMGLQLLGSRRHRTQPPSRDRHGAESARSADRSKASI